jgi:hypothetical protein
MQKFGNNKTIKGEAYGWKIQGSCVKKAPGIV